jgi:hypothetical protein
VKVIFLQVAEIENVKSLSNRKMSFSVKDLGKFSKTFQMIKQAYSKETLGYSAVL